MTPLPARVRRVPGTAVLELTTACNLRCLHCELEAGLARPAELTIAEWTAVANDLAALGCTNASLTGGEPLLRRDWPCLAAHLTGLGIQVKIVTNGLLITPATVDQMVDAGVYAVAVSIDGKRDVHDQLRQPPHAMASRYDTAVRALMLLRESSICTAVITQIHRLNLHDLAAIYQSLVDLGVEAWQVQLTFPYGRAIAFPGKLTIDPSDIPALHRTLAALTTDGRVKLVVADNIGYYAPEEPRLRKGLGGASTFWVGCMAGCLGVCICSDGRVKGCPTHPDCFAVGNVSSDPLATIWNDPARFPYNTAWDESKLAGSCATCPFKRLCRAGCTSMAYAVTGTIYDNPYCYQRAR